MEQTLRNWSLPSAINKVKRKIVFKMVMYLDFSVGRTRHILLIDRGLGSQRA